MYKTIVRYNALLCHQVVISSYLLRPHAALQHRQLQYMHHLAAHNFSSENVRSAYPAVNPEGLSLTLSSPHQVPALMHNFSQVLPYRPSAQAKLGLPVQDLTGRSMVVPFFKACMSGSKQGSKPEEVIGVVGLDIQLADIAEHITYFTTGQRDVYAFLLTPQGQSLGYIKPLQGRRSQSSHVYCYC